MKVTKENFFDLIDSVVQDKFAYLEEITVKSVKQSVNDFKTQLPLEFVKNQEGLEDFYSAHIFTFNDDEYNEFIVKSLKNMYPNGIINLSLDYEFSNYILNLAENWNLGINYL